jgi:hypothetical protein
MSILLALLAMLIPPAAVDGLRSTAPAYLTAESAREHLAAAVIAAMVTDIDPALLLSIAWHESRYEHGAVTAEPGHRVSCGVMTPEPIARCPRAMSVLDGYLAGARHLAGWRSGSRNDVEMLQGYAGGYYMIRFCASGGRSRGCDVPSVFRARAEWIRRSTSGETSWTRTKRPST